MEAQKRTDPTPTSARVRHLRRKRTVRRTHESNLFPQLPVELWIKIVSMVRSISAIIALNDTSSLLRQVVLLPASNEWASALSYHETGNPIDTLPDQLVNILRSYLRESKNYFGEPAAHNYYDASEIIDLFASRYCSECDCKCVTGTVYWDITRRLCKVCIHTITIKESALFFMTGDEDVYDHNLSECFEPLYDLDDRRLHFRSENHYLIDDLEFDFRNDRQLMHFEEINGLSYILRKAEAVQALRLEIHDGGEGRVEGGYGESESDEEIDSDSGLSNMDALSIVSLD